MRRVVGNLPDGGDVQQFVDLLERDVGRLSLSFQEVANRLLPWVRHVVTGVTSNDLVQLGVSVVALKPVPVSSQRPPPEGVAIQGDPGQRQLLVGQVDQA